MDQPLVSICIPVYNGEATIAETLQSLLNQTYQNIEIHVIDNASTDRTRDVVRSFQSDLIVLHEYEEYEHIAEKNHSRCMHVGKGKYRAIYHSDDVYHKTMVEVAVKALEENPEVDAVSTRAILINPKGKKIGTSKTFKQLGLPDEAIAKFSAVSLLKLVLRHYNFMIYSSLMARSEVFDRLQSVRWGMAGTSSDLDLWLRIAEQAKIGVISVPLISYRLRNNPGEHMFTYFNGRHPDIYNVLDYWINKDSIKAELSTRDFQQYEKLLYRDLLKFSGYALLKRDLKASAGFFEEANQINSSLSFWFFESKDYKYFLLKVLIILARKPFFGRLFYPLLRLVQP